MKNLIIHKIIISACMVIVLILSLTKIILAINDSYNKVNHCYMVMYERIAEEKEGYKCW